MDHNGNTIYSKLNLVRVPLRLGFDVFGSNEISPEKQAMFVETMKAYNHLIKAYKVDAYKACATSAMRDAKNATEIINLIKKEANIQIEIIDGDMEANLIYENHEAENMDKANSYLYIDVGGGSTELSFFSNGLLVFKKSFNIGTIRLLKNLVASSEWEVMKNVIKNNTKNFKNIKAIGSGGNINKVFSLSKKKDGRPLPIDLLREYYNDIEPLSIPQRIEKYAFRADRADVIVPALLLYINTMRWAGASEIYVPKIGLADGLIKHLWEEVNATYK